MPLTGSIKANTAKNGACCNEMDIWEANSKATALTPHPCNITGVYKCSGALCGNADRYAGVCDKDGCDYNAYRLGQLSYYQPNATLDTNRKFTVVTQFLTTTGNSTGDLREIRRLYVQDGKVIENAQIQVPGIDRGNSITDEFCAQEKKAFGGVNAFAAQGGMRQMGEAIRRGMVLVFSVWDDAGGSMKWLDSTTPDNADPLKDPGSGRGPCKIDEGKAEDIQANAPWTQVKFSNVKSGEIGSTYQASAK
ncbi:putative endoglucanase [Diplogelasinospora grovesii]|uniref:Glucanase n=1 Tax=Diplogelasinospora grovesii TaxID=303347 RepID=A0AAN6N6L4_9PEZI|nr:putative endoglucanase [Diplogelasinospora grovesii]